jgi:hypothetical protein
MLFPQWQPLTAERFSHSETDRSVDRLVDRLAERSPRTIAQTAARSGSLRVIQCRSTTPLNR